MTSELDQRIRAELKENERGLYDQLDGDMGLVDMAAATFAGRRRWLNIIAYIYTFAFFGLMIFCVVKFIDAETLKPTVGWAAGALACAMAMQALKLWLWDEMRRAGLLREIKRVELQLASLTALVNEKLR